MDYIIPNNMAIGLTLEQLQKQGAVKKGGGIPLESLQSQKPSDEPSFLERTSERLGERAKKIGEAEEEFARGKRFGKGPTFAESTLQTAGQLTGGLFDIGGEALVSALKLVPGFIKEPVKDVAEEVLKSPIGQAGLKAISSGIEEYRSWKAGNPRAAVNLESVVNIVSLLPVGAGTKIVGKEALATTGELAGKLAKPLEARLAKQTIEETLEIIKPQLTKIQKKQALEAGRGIVSGKILPRRFEKITVAPTPRELEMANILDGIITKSKNPVENIETIDNEIVKLATSVQEGLAENNAIFNKNQLRAALDKTKAESRIVFGTDATLQNNYNAVVDEMVRQAGSQTGNVSGLLQARKNFDKIIESKFPKILSNPLGDTARQNAIRDVRRAVNDFIADKLPEGNLFKAQLRQQSLMYGAIKNISKKTAELVDASTVKKVMQALRQNPLVAGVTGGILTYGALMGMFSNPLVIGTLMAGGSIKFGKTIVTSKTLKTLLLRSLHFLETQGHKAGNSESIKAVDTILRKIDEGEISVGLSIKEVGGKNLLEPLAQEARKYKTAEEFVKAHYSYEDNPKIAQAFDEISLGGKLKWQSTEGAFGSKIQPFYGKVELPDGTTKLITKQSEVFDLAKQYGKPISSLFEQKPDIISKLIDARDNAKFNFKLSTDKTQIEVNANGIKFNIPRGEARMADSQQIKVRQYLNALIEKKQFTEFTKESLHLLSDTEQIRAVRDGIKPITVADFSNENLKLVEGMNHKTFEIKTPQGKIIKELIIWKDGQEKNVEKVISLMGQGKYEYRNFSHPYHSELGKLLGYSDKAIQDFAAGIKSPVNQLTKSQLTDFYNQAVKRKY